MYISLNSFSFFIMSCLRHGDDLNGCSFQKTDSLGNGLVTEP